VQPVVVEMGPTARQARLALQWGQARRDKDYDTADGIRAALRREGVEAEELLFEVQTFGLDSFEEQEEEANDTSTPSSSAPEEPESVDPLGYQPHATGSSRDTIFKPTDLASSHKDGGTNGLLTISYSTVPELPPDIGFTVMSQKWVATAEPLIALKKIKEEEEEIKRRETNARNARHVRS